MSDTCASFINRHLIFGLSVAGALDTTRSALSSALVLKVMEQAGTAHCFLANISLPATSPGHAFCPPTSTTLITRLLLGAYSSCSRILYRASNQSSRKFHNYGEGPSMVETPRMT